MSKHTPGNKKQIERIYLVGDFGIRSLFCKSNDVEQLEAQHAAVCAMLEKVVNSAKHTISPVYSAVTEEWRNDYEYRLPTEVIREARMFVDRINTQNQITNTNGYQP